MMTSSGIGSKDGGEPNNCEPKDREKVNIIDWERNLNGLSYIYIHIYGSKM